MTDGRLRSVAGATVIALGALGLLAAAGTARAQEAGSVTVDPRGGVVFPVGALDEVTDFSVSVGGGLAYRVSRDVAIRGDLRYGRLDGETDEQGRAVAPSLDLLHYTAGVAVDFPRPRWQNAPLSFQMNLGVGATRMSGSERYGDGSRLEFDQTYPTLTAGGKIGLPVASRIRAFVASEAYLIFADEDDTAVLTDRAPGADPFDTGWTVPLTVGIEASFR